ncbi:dethiobiotin synthase [Aliidiomarina indica]|uniref:dethiobiotin synthase n=1 Tax=Aliidiomarina indica TaxID=2749147 RepID=UPI00189006F7|nr:dethiobiotin synthase [Aliidiomarina indica]
MTKCIFITGTDTDSGKTRVSELLLQYWRQRNLSTLAMKPISAGCTWNEESQRLENSDALTLQAAATISVDYHEVNPIALAPPIAPHIAAELVDEHGLLMRSTMAWQTLYDRAPDVLLSEGAGGWMLPLDQGDVMPQFVRETNQEVILVVGMKLGCLNHALLTVAAIAQSGCHLRGWIANQLSPEPMPYYRENIETLKARIQAPLLAEVPFLENEDSATQWLAAAHPRLDL